MMLDPIETIKIFQKQPEPQAFVAGQVIFQAGQPSDLMYGVLEGQVELLVNQKAVEVLQPGGVFGIGALISAGNRPYTAIAKTDCKLVFLEKKHFLFAIQETPLFALEVLKIYSDRLNWITHHLT